MGSKHVNHKEKFLEKGLIPLEEIHDHKQKVECIDSEGYKYYLSYHSGVGDKRTKRFDKWDKTNPFKAYNMRLYALSLDENIEILSTDEELFNASNGKVRFHCPVCGEEYSKKWCHWLEQPEGRKNCQKCNFKQSQYSILTEEWLRDNNIPYIREYRFEDCRDKLPLPFDFRIEWNDKVILIEVDGSQHYYKSFGDDGSKLKDQQNKDRIKTKYCEENGYILLRLPWTKYNNNTYKQKLNETFFA